MALHEHIERLADKTPDRAILTVGHAVLTARQLERFANRIAWSLRDLGVAHGDLVAVALPRDFTLIPALLGVLKCGAAYVPIDPHLPEARIRSMLDDAGARYALVDTRLPSAAPYSSQTCLDPHLSDELSDNHTRPGFAVADTDSAYVIYTSGTTGRPKGVVIEHRSVENLVRGWSRAIPFPAGATMSSLATVAFDIFVAETFLPMIYGLRVALATDDDVASPSAIADFLEREKVTCLQVTPSRLSWLLANDSIRNVLARAQLIIVGGEAFPVALLEELTGLTRAAVYNVYGPTEATVWTSAQSLIPGAPITIGSPILGVAYHLVAESGREPPTGDVGELCISGGALARGYLGDLARTRQRFGTGHRLYRTGDLARRIGNGELQIIGRMDQQIKIDGYRVELAEVESVLARVREVRDAVVVPLDGGVSKTLVGVLTPGLADIHAAWTEAAKVLPRFMMPSTLIAVDALPLSPAGKVDRNAVTSLVREHLSRAAEEDPFDYLRAIVERWIGEPVSADDAGLLGLGVGSLGAARLTAEIACRYETHLSLSDIIEAPSLRDLASLIRNARPGPVRGHRPDADRRTAAPAGGSGPVRDAP